MLGKPCRLKINSVPLARPLWRPKRWQGGSVPSAPGAGGWCVAALAVGREHRKLGLSNEDEWTGRGVSFCSTCDAPLHRGNAVGVVGGGDAAVKGAVLLGKTNTSEFGMAAFTSHKLGDPCGNPWHPNRIAGGSSGGAAAAVAARLVPAAHGNDGGGSIRIPASCCGLFGLKPTRARNPLGPDYGHPSSLLAAEHALTRTVRDSAALLDATCGPDVGDPYWAPPPERLYIDEVGADPGKLRISFSVQTLAGKKVHPDCVDAVHEAAALCAELGHEVTEAAPEIDGDHLKNQFLLAFSSSVASAIERLSRVTGRTLTSEDFEPATWAACERGRGLSAADYLLVVGDLQRISRQMGHFLTSCDVWLTPTLAEPPVPLGTFDRTLQQYRDLGDDQVLSFIPFTPICNVTGLPGMSIPLHWNAGGLPVGTHFVGRFGDEATLFRLAAQLEEARPWVDRRPPICA